MKLKLSFGLILLSLFAINIEQLQAQSANDPVIMTINGRPILRLNIAITRMVKKLLS